MRSECCAELCSRSMQPKCCAWKAFGDKPLIASTQKRRLNCSRHVCAMKRNSSRCGKNTRQALR